MKQDLFGVPLFWNAIVFETNGGGGGGGSSSSDDDDGPQLSPSAQSQIGNVQQDERGNWYAVVQNPNSNTLGRDYSIDPKDNSQGPTFGANVSDNVEEMFPDEVAAAGGSSDFQGSITDTFKDTDVASAGFDPATNTYTYNPITPDVDPLSMDLPTGGPGTFPVGSMPAAPVADPIDYTMSVGEAGRGGPDSAAPTQGITSLSPVVNLDTTGFGTSDLTSDRGYDFSYDPRGDQIVSPTGTGIGLTTGLGQNNDRLRQADDIISTTTGMVGVDDSGNLIQYGMDDDSTSTPTGGEYFDLTDNDLLKNADGTLFSGTYGGVEYTRGVPSEEIVMSQDVVAPMSFDDLYKTVIFPTRDSDEKTFGTINADAFASGVARGILSPTTYDGRTIGVPYPANVKLVKDNRGRVSIIDAATGNVILPPRNFAGTITLGDGTPTEFGGEFPDADDVFTYQAAYQAGVPIYDPQTGEITDQFLNFSKQLEDSGFNYSNEMIKSNQIFQPGEGVEAVMDADAIAAAMGGNTFTQGGEGQLGTGFAQAPLYDYITVDSYSEDDYNAMLEAEREKRRNQIELPAIDEIATGGGGGGASPDIGSGGTNLLDTIISGGGGGGDIAAIDQGGSTQMDEGQQNLSITSLGNPNENYFIVDEEQEQVAGPGVVVGDPRVTSVAIGPGFPGSGETDTEVGLASLDTTQTTGEGQTGDGEGITTLTGTSDATTTGTGDSTGDGSGETDDIGLDGENLGGTGDDIGVTGDGGVGVTGVDTVTTGGTGGTGDGDTGGEGTGDEEGEGGTEGEGEGTGDGEGDGDGSGTGPGTGDGTGGGDGTGDGPGTGPGDDDDEVVIDDEDDDEEEDEAPFECPEGYVAKKVGGKWVCKVEQEDKDFDGVRPLIRPRYEDVQIASTYTPIKLGT